MEVAKFIEMTKAEFFTGVPDSKLKALCNYLYKTYGISNRHIIAANEGNCVGIAAGYHMATGKIPMVYLQNSGIGNIVNPVASLLNPKVYGIPCIFVVGWRGEPNIPDEPQHLFQGEITEQLLNDIGLDTYVISKGTTDEEVAVAMENFQVLLQKGKSVAFVIKDGGLYYDESVKYSNSNVMKREEIIEHIVNVSETDPIISTTGKSSRELFEIRAKNQSGHCYDFLTVGSMGHASSIALGVALNQPNKKIWCIDGDGAALMHMGALSVIANQKPNNLVHVVINNGAHESVGGQPTVMAGLDISAIAVQCGYPMVEHVCCFEDLDEALVRAKQSQELCLIEIESAIGAREDLGRPTIKAIKNKENFMNFLKA